jgi:phosphoribosylformylglycinamidine synthase
MARIAFAGEGETILLFGAPESYGGHLGQSAYLRTVHGREDGPPPPVDLAHERRVGDFVRSLIREGETTAVHDCSDGGLAVALPEMAMASGIGAIVEAPADASPTAAFFGEDQGRYIATMNGASGNAILERAAKAGIPVRRIGITGGAELKLGGARAIPIEDLKAAHEGWFPRFMEN